MTRTYHQIFSLALFAAVFAVSAQPIPAAPAKPFATVTNNSLQLPLPPLPQSPVVFFRQLLVMSPAERIQSLTNRTAEARVRIMAKVREYLAMDPNDRELRLRATDLRWYLTPLFRMTPDDRKNRLQQIPSELRGLVISRLAEWDALPVSTQQAMLANAKTLPYFARVDTNSAPLDATHQKIADQFNSFFDLNPAEQSQCLATLSDAERTEMEKTLQSFQSLPPQKRFACIQNYARFTGMSSSERAEFLKNAQKWSQMSPSERQTWRNLVAQVPQWPMVPPAIRPNMIPPHPPPKPRPSMATNAE